MAQNTLTEDAPQKDENTELNPKTKRTISIISVLIVIALMIVCTVFLGGPLVKFASEPEKFREWIDSFGIWGSIVFIGITVLQIIVAIIPGEPFEIAAGYAFGFWQGTALCLIGIVIGSTAVFLFTKKFGIKAAEAFFTKEKIEELSFIKNSQKLNALIFIVFFIPGTPKDLLTYFVGLTPIKLSTWLIICTVARIPSVITSVIGGNALGMESYLFALIVFGATGLLSLIGILIYRKMSKNKE